MIGTLDDAWAWYQGTKKMARWMNRLGAKYWDAIPWDGAIGRDPHLGHLGSAEIAAQTARVLDDLDDLCVLLLFSAFETIIRSRVLTDIEARFPPTDHPTIRSCWEAILDGVRRGSFGRVMEPFKDLDADLVEQVNQVRHYRNWVAHGKSGPSPDSVKPEEAFDRLGRFLTLITT